MTFWIFASIILLVVTFLMKPLRVWLEKKAESGGSQPEFDFTPEEKAYYMISSLERMGEKMKPGAYEAFLEAYRNPVGPMIGVQSQLGAIADAYSKPKGVQMPWGKWVKFTPSKAT